jgi:hypothetical protein
MSDPTQPTTPITNGAVLESGLTYAPPGTEPSPTFDSEAAKAIADITNSWGNPEPEPETEEPQEEETESTEGALDTVAKEEPDDPAIERGVSRLVTRELAAKEREAAADARAKAAEAAIAELKSLKGLKSSREQADRMAIDPVGVMKEWGHDPETIIRLALAQQLEATGQEVPTKLQEFVRDAGTKRELATLRSQLAAQERARAAQDYFNTVSNGAREYVTKSVGDSTPTVARAAKANPERVHREIMDEIVRDSNTRAAQDPDGDPMSYADAAKAVEARWVELKKLLTEGQVQNGKTATPTAAKPMPPSPKPAAKPLAPWMTPQKDVYSNGIDEALRAYASAEAARKQKQG